MAEEKKELKRLELLERTIIKNYNETVKNIA